MRRNRKRDMKTSGKLLAAALALSLANFAFAAATLKDVETAVKVNHDYIQGESLMREVVANNQGNARDHYVLSQILDHNGKHVEAERELPKSNASIRHSPLRRIRRALPPSATSSPMRTCAHRPTCPLRHLPLLRRELKRTMSPRRRSCPRRRTNPAIRCFGSC